MNGVVSANTKAILLLTAPLNVGRPRDAAELITPSEYKRLRFRLAEVGRQPADLLGLDGQALLAEIADETISAARLQRLMGRGFLLGQAIERWHSRAIWIVSRADSGYPKRLKDKLKDDAPPLLYGCGKEALLEHGGLAIVGSRAADEELLEYAASAARMAAKSGLGVVSGGARGIDRAAMSSALDAGGRVVGVLADSLDTAAISRELREPLMSGQMTLISPFDPLAPFLAGHAMQRNKVVYALADAALVVNADKGKGGTWAGAIEQLTKYRSVPLYVRMTGPKNDALVALAREGAFPWPEPRSPGELARAVEHRAPSGRLLAPTHTPLLFGTVEPQLPSVEQENATTARLPADSLFDAVRSLLLQLVKTPQTERAIAAELGTTKPQTAVWLKRLVSEGILQKRGKPVKYSLLPERGAASSPEPSDVG